MRWLSRQNSSWCVPNSARVDALQSRVGLRRVMQGAPRAVQLSTRTQGRPAAVCLQNDQQGGR